MVLNVIMKFTVVSGFGPEPDFYQWFFSTQKTTQILCEDLKTGFSGRGRICNFSVFSLPPLSTRLLYYYYYCLQRCLFLNIKQMIIIEVMYVYLYPLFFFNKSTSCSKKGKYSDIPTFDAWKKSHHPLRILPCRIE